jgi:hypothetical protein
MCLLGVGGNSKNYQTVRQPCLLTGQGRKSKSENSGEPGRNPKIRGSLVQTDRNSDAHIHSF